MVGKRKKTVMTTDLHGQFAETVQQVFSPLVADGASLLLPGVAGRGMIVRALTHVDEAV